MESCLCFTTQRLSIATIEFALAHTYAFSTQQHNSSPLTHTYTIRQWFFLHTMRRVIGEWNMVVCVSEASIVTVYSCARVR